MPFWSRATAISNADLAECPQFLRFDEISLARKEIGQSEISVEQESQLFLACLRPLKSILNDSNLCLCVTIDRNDRTHFGSQSEFLDHIRGELLPICDSSRGYQFTVWLMDGWYNREADQNLIASILQAPQVKRSSNVKIFLFNSASPEWPIEAISNWLHQNYDSIRNLKGLKERFLRISTCNATLQDTELQDTQKLIDHLKKVTHFMHRNLWLNLKI